MSESSRVNTGMRLMPATVRSLDAAGERMGGKSRAFVVEVLTALYAHDLDADTQVPVGMVPVDTRARKEAKEPEAMPPVRAPAPPKRARGRPRKEST